MKRWIAVLLLIACLTTLLPVTAAAQEAPQEKTTEKKLVALTFDDGPGAYTQTLLDGLAERGARVTFFMTGSCAEDRGDIVRRVFREGHQIAQHTYSHPLLSSLSGSSLAWQLEHTDEILNGHLGENFKYLLRPPYGDNNAYVLSVIGRPAIMWSVDTYDWKNRNSTAVCNNIVNWSDDGDIILCHDIHSTTIPGALAAIDILQAQGYEFVTINELFRRRGLTLEDGEKYYYCKTTDVDYGRASAPVISAVPIYGGMQAVLTADPGAEIYYTLDGSDPLTCGQRYTGPVELPISGATVRAIAAFDRNGDRSEESSAFLLPGQGQEVQVRVVDGCVVFDNPNPDSELFYTTEDVLTEETAHSYTQPIPCFDGKLLFSVVGQGFRSWTKTIYVTKEGSLFWDVPTDAWYAGEVNAAVLSGIFNGTGEYLFEPEANITRAMFVTALYRMLEGKRFSTVPTEVSFPDVPEDEWYSEAVAWAAGYRIVNGYEDCSFRPEALITREEICTILDRLLQIMRGRETHEAPDFIDADSIAFWAVNGVARMVAAGVIRGDELNAFHPQDNATRAETAAILLRLKSFLSE